MPASTIRITTPLPPEPSPLSAPRLPQISVREGEHPPHPVASLYEVTDRRGARLSVHTTFEAADSAADDLWGRDGYDLHDELDGSTAYVSSEFDGESRIPVTLGFVREVQP